MAEVSRFSALMAPFLGKKADKEEDKPQASEKPVKRDDESEEEFQDRLRKWEEEDSGSDAKKGAENPKDTSEDDQDKGEKLKKAEADGFANGVKAANTRWTDVLASAEAQGKVVTACDLLADTDLEAAAIKKALAKISAPTARTTLSQRQAANPTPAPATDGGQALTGAKGFAARVVAARDQALGVKTTS